MAKHYFTSNVMLLTLSLPVINNALRTLQVMFNIFYLNVFYIYNIIIFWKID